MKNIIGVICLSIIFAIILHSASVAMIPSLRLLENEKQRIDLSYEQETLIQEMEYYKTLSDRIYDTVIDPIGDTYSETDLGALYLAQREKVDSLLEKMNTTPEDISCVSIEQLQQ